MNKKYLQTMIKNSKDKIKHDLKLESKAPLKDKEGFLANLADLAMMLIREQKLEPESKKSNKLPIKELENNVHIHEDALKFQKRLNLKISSFKTIATIKHK